MTWRIYVTDTSLSSIPVLFMALHDILITVFHKLLVLHCVPGFYLWIWREQHIHSKHYFNIPYSPYLPTVLFFLYCKIHRIYTRKYNQIFQDMFIGWFIFSKPTLWLLIIICSKNEIVSLDLYRCIGNPMSLYSASQTRKPSNKNLNRKHEVEVLNSII